AEALLDGLREADMVDVLVREHHQTDVGEAPAVQREPRLQLGERFAGARARIDEREWLALDQVAVDSPDRERRRECNGCDAVAAHAGPSLSMRRDPLGGSS